MRRLGLALALAAAPEAHAQALLIEHEPPACILAEKSPVLLACVRPHSSSASVRVLFRADEGPWYAAPLRSEMPCHRGLLPRPTAGTPSVSYVIEARAGGLTARSAEHRVPVERTCLGPAAPVGTTRATWESPEGAPRTPPGFEGARVRAVTAEDRPAPAPTPPPVVSARATPPPPVTAATGSPAPAEPAPPAPAGHKDGHGLRNAAIVVGGAAAAGGTALALRSGGAEGASPATTGSGLPPSGIPGLYVGTETITYSSSCSGTDDIVLELQQSSSALSGVLSFTVRTCPCCSAGRGASPVSGFVSDTRVDLSTPIGFAYTGSFAGNRLSGTIGGPAGVTGTWNVEKR
ncbi:MAG TPA: hypothetical protein VFQ51_01650 [Vicinamibacteria bacterium]|nr:hypothetical protein [Vicinamibacteria bacterium]